VEVSGLPRYTNKWYGCTVIECRACNLTACLTGQVKYPFACHHEGPGFDPWGGTYTPVSVVPLATIASFGLALPMISRTIVICPDDTVSTVLSLLRLNGVIVHNAAQESKMNALVSYLFHGVVNQTYKYNNNFVLCR
jgi:hypothetical protein